MAVLISAALLLTGLLIIGGGVGLVRRQNFGLALAGALLAIVPGASLLGFTGIAQYCGLKSVIVLLDRNMRRQFS